MSAEKPKIIPLAVMGIALPIVFGVVIELACDLLKSVVHYFSTSIYFDVQHNILRELRELDIWIGLVFAILLVALSTWILDNWKWAHPKREVRTGLLLISVIFAAILDPFGHIFKDEVLKAYGEAYIGESMPDVLRRFQHETPSLVWPHKDQGDGFDCIGNCWLRLTYDVPVIFGERSISLEFDRDQKLSKKCE